MPRDDNRVKELILDGNCCAQVQVRMALELRGEENEQLVQAVGGLCGGARSGLTCGAFTGACCALTMFDPALARDEMIPALLDWFVEKWGSSECSVILDGDPTRKTTLCPMIMWETWDKTRSLLEEYGYDFE